MFLKRSADVHIMQNGNSIILKEKFRSYNVSASDIQTQTERRNEREMERQRPIDRQIEREREQRPLHFSYVSRVTPHRLSVY